MINLKQEKGITLLALVITVVILLILSTITINSFNTNGGTLISAAENKKEQMEKEVIKQEIEVAIEKVKLENSDAVNKNISDFIIKLQEKLRLNDAEATVTLNEDNPEEKYDVTYKENKFTYYLDTKPTAVLKTDILGKTYYLPNGFYYVGGVVDDGIVISDSREDEAKYAGQRDVGKDLKGNQYVWVPVDGTNIRYEKHEYATPIVNDTNEKNDTGNGNWRTYYYRYFVDWSDGHYIGQTQGKMADGVTNKTIYNYEDETANNIASVEKYGGFYIARYEAGYAPASAGTQHTGSKNNANQVPNSKAYYQTWNSVSQVNASLACDKLNDILSYSNVRARLVDGVAWDVAVNYISSKVNSVIDSSSYGAYYNGTAEEDHLIYYPFIYIYDRTNSQSATWYQTRYYKDSGNTKIKLAITEMNTDALKDEVKEILGVDTLEEGAKYRRYIELATGAAESTKVNNIYDLAGNVWEWTTENGYWEKEDGTKDSSERQFAVLRGGCFNSSFPVPSSSGYNVLKGNYLNVGFRSVLYIK